MKDTSCPICGNIFYEGGLSGKYRVEICTDCLMKEKLEELILRLEEKGVMPNL
ncbi:MAG: hypothetical protein ACOX0E_00620 [Syntrophomonadaceae bacterium]|jgi:hypothetical protein